MIIVIEMSIVIEEFILSDFGNYIGAVCCTFILVFELLELTLTFVLHYCLKIVISIMQKFLH